MNPRQSASAPVSIAAIFCAIPSKVCVATLLTCEKLSVALSAHSPPARTSSP
ncbi:phage tail length tape-measure 1 domain protein, partial [Escherichia coli DEC8A]